MARGVHRHGQAQWHGPKEPCQKADFTSRNTRKCMI
jgi:hypothetical protein